MVLAVKAIAQLAMLGNDCRTNFHCVTVENGELQSWVNVMDEKISAVGASAEKLLVNVSFLTGGRDTLAIKCEEYAVIKQCMAGLGREARILRTQVMKLQKLS